METAFLGKEQMTLTFYSRWSLNSNEPVNHSEGWLTESRHMVLESSDADGQTQVDVQCHRCGSNSASSIFFQRKCQWTNSPGQLL